MKIDLVNYHNGDLLKSEYASAKEEVEKLLLDTSFSKNVSSLFDKYYASLSSKARMRILCRIYVASTKEKSKFEIKDLIVKTLPIHLFNLRHIAAPRLFLLEVNNACTYNCSVYLASRLSLKKEFKNEEEKYLIYLVISLLKSLSSIFSLFELGDDVHAFSLMRGFLEQEIKLCLLLQDNELIKDYILFNKYNSLRRHNLETQEMKELFANKRVYSSTEKESYLPYGWADRRTKVMSFRRLLEIYNEEDAPKIYTLYGAMSEFVHEDHIGVNYDYIKMREKFSSYLTLIFFKFMYPLIQQFFSHDILVLNGIKIKDLVDLGSIKNELKEFVPTLNVNK